MRGKPAVLVLGVLGAAVVVVAASRTWVTGRVSDAVLGSASLEVTGSEAAPGLVALALVVAAATVAALTTGRVARMLALALDAGALLAAAWLTVRVLLVPEAVLGPVAAAAAGRTGSLPTTASASAWPWVALAALAGAGAGVVLAVSGARSWSGLSSRYDAPTGGGGVGSRGERVSSDWDRLSAGEDPTAPTDPGGVTDVGPGGRT